MSTTRIYIVEDEALIAMEISDRLTQLGYKVCGKAAQGEQALEEVPLVSPDIVLMDLYLAGELTGIDTAARLRQRLDVPVVFLSALSDAALLKEALGTKPFGYLIKPFEERELHATLQAALYKHRLECTLRETTANLDEVVRQRTDDLWQSEAKIRALNENLECLVAARTDELRESKERYRTLVATVPGAIYEFRVDAAGHRSFRFMSDGIAELMGLSAAKCMANADVVFQQIPLDALPAMETSIRHSSGRLSPWLHEFPIRTTTGEDKWLRGHSMPYRKEDGSTHWHGVLVDITAQKQTAGALRASEERFRAAYHNASVGISICDLTGRWQEVNQALCEILGYSKQELLAKDFQSLTHQADLPDNLDRIRQLLTGAAVHQVFEKRYLKKDGSTVWAQMGLSVIRDSDGTPSHLLAMVQDISERKRAEAALTAKTHELSDFIEHATVSMHWVGPDGIILWANQTELDLLGYTREEYIGRQIADFHVNQLAIQNILDRLSRGEPVQEHIASMRSKDGSIKDVLIDSSVLWRDGKFIHTRCFTRDITEHKQTERALQFLSAGIAHLNGDAFFSEMAVQMAQLLGVEIGFVGKLMATQTPRIRALGLSIDGKPMPPVEYDLAQTPCERVISKHTAIFTEHVQQLFPDDRMLVDLGVSSYGAIPLFDMHGRPIGHVGVMSRRPLQEVKQVEAILRLFAVCAAGELERQRTETKFQDLFEFSPDAIIMVNQEGLITLTNHQAESLFGYSREEFRGLPVETLIPESERQGHMGLRQQFLAAPKPQMMGASRPTLHALKKDGTIFPADISLSPIQSEDGLLVVAALRDITERKQAEQALGKSEERFRMLFEQAAVGVAQVDTATGRFVRINDKYCEITGYSQAEMLALTVQQLTHPDDWEAGQNNMARLTAGEIQEFRLEKRYVRKDGSVAWVKLVVSPMWMPGASPDYNIAVVQDITERKEADAALQAFQDQIRQMQKMEALGQLAGGVAHDFNNILTAILGNAEMACAKLAADHPSRPNLMRILEASDRASRLVQQILTFTHQQEFSRTVLALAPVVNEVLTLLQATLPAGIELTTTYDAATPHVLADATQIHQVVMNLCTNAWHALEDQSGSIAVNLAPITLTQPLLGLQTTLPPGFYAHLSVRDTGCGMDPDTATRIFDPFFTTKPVGQGTGLGLSVVHGIVRGHEGAIVVESHPGQGTTFHLYFHAVEAPAHESEPTEATRVPRQGGSRHLLYLDDEEMLVELARALFEPLGYRVTGCTGAAEALDAVRADPGGFDVVLTDYNMPGMSGLEVARALSLLRADLPVVLVSGFLSLPEQAAALAAGVKEIIYKPTTLQQLGDVVTRLINTPPQA